MARTSVSSSTGRSSSKKSPVASGSAIQTYSRTTRASSGNARVRVRHVVQAAHQRRDVDRRVWQRERFGAAGEVAVVGVELAGALDRYVDADRLRARGGERAHERAVATADVDDEAALEFDGVRELVEVGHAVQRRLPRVRRPLDDVRVLAIEQFGAGPWATLQLADLGAEVIKVEDPASGGDVGRYVPPYREGEDSLYFETFNRGKRSVSLDLRSSAGRAVFEDLVRGQRRGLLEPARRPAGEAADHLRRPARAEPADRLLLAVGLRHDRPAARPSRPTTTSCRR